MTNEEKIKIGEAWAALGNLYGKEINRAAMNIILKSVSGLNADAVLNALEGWPATSKYHRPPYPSEVIEIVDPRANLRDVAINTSSRIRHAVSKFGWSNQSDAKNFIGDMGWRYVERIGGWKYLCENLGTNISETTFIAQCRDAVASDQNLAIANINTDQPTLEQVKNRTSTNELIGKIIENKQIE